MNRRSGNPYSGRRFRRALGYFVVGRAAQALASVIVVLLAIRVLPPVDYGTYMVLLGIVEICRPLTSLGLLPAVQQFLPEMALHASPTQLQGFVRWLTIARFAALLGSSLLLFAFWTPLSRWLGFESTQDSDAWVACLLVVTMLGATFTNHMLEALLEQRFAQYIRALTPVGRLLGLLLMAAAGKATLVNMLWVDITVTTTCLILAEGVLIRQLQRLRPDGSRKFERREIVSFIWHLSAAQVMNSVANVGTLRLVVSATLGVTAAGQFAFLQQLLNQVTRFLPSLMFANLVRPVLIASHVTGQRARVAAASGLLWKSNILFALPLVGLTLVGGDPLAALLSGGRLATSGLALTLMMLAAASTAQGQITNDLLQVFRHTALVRKLSLLALASPAAVYAGSALGLAGAAGGVAVASWLRSGTTLIMLGRREPYIRMDAIGALRIVAAVVVALGAAWPLRAWAPLMALGIAVLLYTCTLLLLKPLSPADGDALATVLTKRMRPVLKLLLRAFARSD